MTAPGKEGAALGAFLVELSKLDGWSLVGPALRRGYNEENPDDCECPLTAVANRALYRHYRLSQYDSAADAIGVGLDPAIFIAEAADRSMRSATASEGSRAWRAVLLKLTEAKPYHQEWP